MEMVRKITTKVMGLNPVTIREAVEINPDGALLYTIAGVAVKIEHGDIGMGPWKVFIGEFQGINQLTGEHFRSPKVFMPSPFQDELEVALTQVEKGGVEFAVHVSAKQTDSEIGYEFLTTQSVPISQSDAMGRLMSAAVKNAPKKTKLPPKEKKDKKKDK